MTNTTRALAHGAHVAATGDTTRLRQIRRRAQTTSIVAESWKNVGQKLTAAMAQSSR